MIAYYAINILIASVFSEGIPMYFKIDSPSDQW